MPQQRRTQLTQMAPPSLLWTTWTDGALVECCARLFESGIYVEVRIGGTPIVGRTFTAADDAAAFSKQQWRVWEERHEAGRITPSIRGTA